MGAVQSLCSEKRLAQKARNFREHNSDYDRGAEGRLGNKSRLARAICDLNTNPNFLVLSLKSGWAMFSCGEQCGERMQDYLTTI